ncbi:MAG: PepSY domain-containing protein [Mediterranea sp.]|jgi:uncharacterized iron-regulated membrane protein|nr:PepSY domain-containing protein [Mediterranea sp.]
MKKLFKKLHLWLSIPFGLIISIICFSGAALVFETEIMELCYPDRYFVSEVKEKAIPVEELLVAVTKTLPDSVTITGVTISSDPERTYQVTLSKPHRAGVYIDQYTGKIKERYQRAAFFACMMRTHRWLLDSMKPDGGIFWGKLIVGTSTLLFVIILITGLVIGIPKTLKGLKNRLSIAVRKGWRRFWYDLHVAGGMHTLIFLLLMALTGLTWSFSWYRNAFYNVFGIEAQQGGGHGHAPQQQSRQGGQRPRDEQRDGRPEGQGKAFRHWQKVYDRLNEQNPGHKQINLSKGAAGVIFNRFGNQRGSDRYTFDAATGEITEASLYKDQPKSAKIRGWIYSVHVGSWGGLLTRILTFLAAFVGGTLPLTGYYLWIKRSFRKRCLAPK